MQRVRISLIFSAAERYGTLVINLASLSAVSHLLAPGEVGLFAVAASVLVVTEAFRDFGLTVHLVQLREVGDAVLRTTFTVMAALSIALATAVQLAAEPLAAFYGEPRLAALLQVIAWGSVAGAISGPLLALMRREFAFRNAALVMVTGALVNGGVSVAAAAAGYGATGLAWASVAGSVAFAAAALALKPCFSMFRPSLAAWRAVLAFGGVSSVTNLVNTLYQMLPQLLLGRFAGMDAAGLYARAVTVAQLPERLVVGAIQPVLLPLFSAHERAGGDLRRTYLEGLGYMAAVCWPPLIALAISAEPVVRIVLGPHWDAAVPLVRILAVGWLAMFPAVLTQPSLVAAGHVRDTLTSSLISLPISALVLFAVSPLGAAALAAASFVVVPLQVYTALHFIRRRLGFAWADAFAAARTGLVPALFSIVGPGTALLATGAGPMPLSVFAAGAVAAAAGWVLGLRATDHPLFEEFARAARHLRRAKAPAAGE